MTDYHAKQFTGTPCSSKNCAAASGAMAVAFGGGSELTADQMRSESKVSCVPGVDTTSGGLRALDVRRVGLAHGVAIVYGNPPESLTSWPVSELEKRLRAGQGAIVLGDAKFAPVSPTTGEVYHSAWVHGLDAQNRTHWHDPRLTGPSWEPLSEVIRYWEQGAPPALFAGFVQPGDEMATYSYETITGPDGKPQTGGRARNVSGFDYWDAFTGAKKGHVDPGDGDKATTAHVVRSDGNVGSLTTTIDFILDSQATWVAPVVPPSGDCTAAIASDRAKAYPDVTPDGRVVVAWRP